MGTRHDEQERDIELNVVTERFEPQRLKFETNHHDSKNATSSVLNKGIKRTIIHYHYVLTTNQFYLFLFTIGVSMDTLFLFIPTINKKNENNKCVSIENKVKIVALVLRSITDIFFYERILYKVLVAFGQPRSSWVCYFNILIDILGVAPLPQVLIARFFTGGESSKQLIKKKNLNSIIVFQYFPRTSTIYLTYLGIKKTSFISPKAVIFWNLLFFFGLSHIFGSFWYFFAVQQEISCWYKADTRYHVGTARDIFNFNCKDNSTMNWIFISNFCSGNQADTSSTIAFDFGIYTEAIKTGLLLNTTDIPSKIIHSFWWGLRNLSSCGQNLQTSGYVWETCFGALITTSGLLLFLYFIGQVQVYIEVLTIAVSTKEKWLGMKYKELDMDVWLNNNNIPNKDKIKKTLMRKIRYMPEIKDIHLKILLPLLSAQERRSMKSWLCHPILKKVAALQNVNNKILEEITTYLKPVIYSEDSYIIREGKPLNFMLLITQGVIWNFKTNDGNNNSVNIMGNCRRILEGNVYGEELLEWILKSTLLRVGSDSDIFISNSDIFISDTNVKAYTKVEAFAIMDKDIRIIVNRFKIRLIQSLAKSKKFDLKPESFAASLIQSTLRWHHHRCDQNKQL